jgi:hypothetical protein
MGVGACAQLLRVSERTIRGWESGQTRIPYAAFKLLRVLKGGRYLSHPIWKDFVIRGDTLITPEGHQFQAGELGWWSLLVRQARAFREVLRDRDDKAGARAPGPDCAAIEGSALGLVSSSTSDPRPTPKTGSTAENKGSGTGQLVAARKALQGQSVRHQQVGRRLARVLRVAGGAP